MLILKYPYLNSQKEKVHKNLNVWDQLGQFQRIANPSVTRMTVFALIDVITNMGD